MQDGFKALLASTPEIVPGSKWRVIEVTIRDKPEFKALEDDRERQRLFVNYVQVRAICCEWRVGPCMPTCGVWHAHVRVHEGRLWWWCS